MIPGLQPIIHKLPTTRNVVGSPLRFTSSVELTAADVFGDLGRDVVQILGQPAPTAQDFGNYLPEKRQRLWEKNLARWTQEEKVFEFKQPEYPVGVPETQLITLPSGYRSPSVVGEYSTGVTYKFPLQSALELNCGQSVECNIDYQPGNHSKVASNPKAIMDLEHDIKAQRLVASGVQPSIITRNWKANWSLERLSRDIWQNFFDGQGGTLEGVKLAISRSQVGDSYRVRIEGEGQYDYEKAYLLGGTSKADDLSKAGHYGEGLKVMALNLLRDFGAQRAVLSAANWKMTYTMPVNSKVTNPKMMRQLQALPSVNPGNYLEFDTTSPELVTGVLKAFNYFAHPYNPDFQNPTVKTKVGGITLHPGRGGNVYIAGQRFSIQEDSKKEKWENPIGAFSIWLNHNILDKGRDRTALGLYDVACIIQHVVRHMEDKDLAHTLQQLKPYWDTKEGYYSYKPVEALVEAIIHEIRDRKLSLAFNPREYAGSKNSISPSTLSHMQALGCKIYPSALASIGMGNVADYDKHTNRVNCVNATAQEARRIKILKYTAARLIKAIKTLPDKPLNCKPLLTLDDPKKTVYIFQRSGKDNPLDHAAGLAWLGNIWMSRETMSNTFTSAFHTYLHELLHRHGGDDTSQFSYAFHDTVTALFTMMMESETLTNVIEEANRLWDRSLKDEWRLK